MNAEYILSQNNTQYIEITPGVFECQFDNGNWIYLTSTHWIGGKRRLYPDLQALECDYIENNAPDWIGSFEGQSNSFKEMVFFKKINRLIRFCAVKLPKSTVEITEKSVEFSGYVGENLAQKHECVVCFEDIEEKYAFVPCGHTSVCSTCSPRLNQCPECRSEIKQRIKIFI